MLSFFNENSTRRCQFLLIKEEFYNKRLGQAGYQQQQRKNYTPETISKCYLLEDIKSIFHLRNTHTFL
uniref:Uncharacterized protein n=1 Tax=Arundo donax TaxID=35708 RepID=A0A0A9DX91_ARUDO